jgi:hypothetical protein
MVPVEGEGECLKIILIYNSSLADLVEVFLGVTRGFDVPVGTMVLMASASHAAAVGTADYAADFVQASGLFRGAFAGAVTVMRGIPFLLGGTKNFAAIRSIAEIESTGSKSLQGLTPSRQPEQSSKIASSRTLTALTSPL